MTTENPTNLPASVRARLKNKADEIGLDFNQVLQYYAMGRFLYRLSKTKCEHFIALLDEYLPNWRALRDQLNSAPLAHEEWMS